WSSLSGPRLRPRRRDRRTLRDVPSHAGAVRGRPRPRPSSFVRFRRGLYRRLPRRKLGWHRRLDRRFRMSEVISVDLSPVIRGLQVVNDNVARVNQQVLVVSQQGEQTRSRLEQLYQEFVAYVTADALRTELQLAETRLVKVRQELDQRFGHYSDVRRRVT